jgi:nucleotide-binding universal stress UspA family protein
MDLWPHRRATATAIVDEDISPPRQISTTTSPVDTDQEDVSAMDITEAISVRGGILVAHDGSPSAQAALRTAVRCAPAFGGHVHVVRAWDVLSAPAPRDTAPGFVPALDEFEAATLDALEQQVGPLRAESPDVTIATSAVHGNIAEELIAASSDVDMIVLGNRGLGGFVGLLLGSVSDQVVHHARCRVLIDRAPDGQA